MVRVPPRQNSDHGVVPGLVILYPYRTPNPWKRKTQGMPRCGKNKEFKKKNRKEGQGPGNVIEFSHFRKQSAEELHFCTFPGSCSISEARKSFRNFSALLIVCCSLCLVWVFAHINVSSVYTAGRISDRGDREIVYAPTAWMSKSLAISYPTR